MTERSFDVVIAGAGIVGAACADAFAREGLRVAIVECDLCGAGATAAGMGHVVVMDDSEAQFALTRYSRQLWHELSLALPAEVEYRQTGTLWIAADQLERAEALRKQQYYEQRGIRAQAIDEAGLAQLEPNLKRGLAGGLLVPDDVVLYPPAAARFLLERAMRYNARTFFGVSVTRIDAHAVQLSDRSQLSAGVIVNATGTYAPVLTPSVGIQPRKGHLAITDRYPGFVQHQLIELGYLKSAHSSTSDSVAFNVQPRATGQMLIGSSRQFRIESKEIDREILARMLERALTYLPELARVSIIRTWTGFRAATPDKLPLIGRVPGAETQWLATGHEGLGITTSLGTAELLVSQVLGKTPPIPAEPYSPARTFVEHAHV